MLQKSPLKMMNSVFYSILKTVPVLKMYLHIDFHPDYFDHIEKLLDKKARVNFKI